MNDIKVPPFTDEQKKLIEMTEKLAQKRGGKICDVDGIDDDITDIKELLNDTISRIENPTNEDWLNSLNTEEKAKFLHDIQFSCNTCTLTSFRWYKSNIMKCPLQVSCAKENGIRDWLKQPHRKSGES